MAGSIVVEVVTLADPHAVGLAADDIGKLADSLTAADAAFRRAARSADQLDAQIERAQSAVSGLSSDVTRMLSSLADSLASTGLDQASAGASALEQSLGEAFNALPAGTQRVETFGAAVSGASAQTESARLTFDAFGRSLDALFNVSMNQDEATLRVQQGMLRLNQTLAENRGHWSTNTESGLANREAVLSQVRAFDDLRRANIRAGMSVDEANKKYDAQVQGLYNLAKAAGAGKKTLDDLVGNYFVHVYVDSITSAVAKAAKSVAKAVNAIGFAAGGNTPANTPYWVGEKGPELRFDASPGFVMSHAQSMAVANAATTGAPGPARVELQFSSDGTDLGNLLVQLISKSVRVKGGNAAVLGIRN